MAILVLTDQLTVKINNTDISDHCARFGIEITAAEQSANAFGNAWELRVGGLKTGTVTLDLHQDFATSKTNVLTTGNLGSYATVVASGTLGGTAVAGTAICLVTDAKPISGAVGDLLTASLSWPTHGSVTGFGL